jgi:hypothetical protein
MWLPILVAFHRPCQLYKNSWWSFWFDHSRAVIHSVAPKKNRILLARNLDGSFRTVLIDLLVAIRRSCAVLWNSTRALIIMGTKRPDFNAPTPKSNRRRKSETKSHFSYIILEAFVPRKVIRRCWAPTTFNLLPLISKRLHPSADGVVMFCQRSFHGSE